tara:strand:+ start:1278 stop:2003 length:726 start_codon:yes stop_codon:yes gene_type:complete
MSRHDKLKLPTENSADYEVGYGKPPRHSRFKKGQSGNPYGRPVGSKNKVPEAKEERLKQIIMEEAYRDIQVREGSRSTTLPVIRAVVRTLANKGLKGETRSLTRLMELVDGVETAGNNEWRKYFESLTEYKQYWEEELERRESLDITDLPEPEPHPDDIVIDPRSGEARVVGPMTPEERPLWEAGRAHIKNIAKGIAVIEDRLLDDPDNIELHRRLKRIRKNYDEHVAVFGLGRPRNNDID